MNGGEIWCAAHQTHLAVHHHHNHHCHTAGTSIHLIFIFNFFSQQLLYSGATLHMSAFPVFFKRFRSQNKPPSVDWASHFAWQTQKTIVPLSLTLCSERTTLIPKCAHPMTWEISAWGALFHRPTATPDGCPFIRVAYCCQVRFNSLIHKTEALAGSIFPRKLWPYPAIAEINTIHKCCQQGKKAVRKPCSLIY
jgi:hypothetical protein